MILSFIRRGRIHLLLRRVARRGCSAWRTCLW